jgi:hypothetical protein
VNSLVTSIFALCAKFGDFVLTWCIAGAKFASRVSKKQAFGLCPKNESSYCCGGLSGSMARVDSHNHSSAKASSGRWWTCRDVQHGYYIL